MRTAAELDAMIPDARPRPAPRVNGPSSGAEPLVSLQRLGPSYRVDVRPLGARFLFRDVRTDRELAADVAVSIGGRHLFRTTATLSLTGRDRIGKTAADLSRGDAAAWRLATFAAVEAILEAEEQLGAPVDLRTAALALPAGGLHVARPLWPVGSVVLTSPGDAGKSTMARAVAVSLAGGTVVIPGIEPVGRPRPVLYVAAEDPVAYWHGRSVDAICRGIGMNRRDLAEPIELFDARGRPLHRIARAIAERAADFGAVILDSQQALLAQLDASGGIRDRDSLFWHAVDQSERPTFIIAHPNRADARDWSKADGRIAGSEVNRDRSRMAWRATWRDEPAVVGTSFRRYTLANTKNNHGPKEPPLAFAAAWQFGYGDDPGVLAFTAAAPVTAEPSEAPLSPPLAAALAAYAAGATSKAPLAEALGIPVNTAKSRLRLLRERGLIGGSDDE
ncbi:MAG: AAA family ATPase [Chloroflexota bacterium]